MPEFAFFMKDGFKLRPHINYFDMNLVEHTIKYFS